MLTIKIDKKKVTITDSATGIDMVLMLYSINKKLTKELIEHLRTFRESSLKVMDDALERVIELDENLKQINKEK